MTIYYGEDLTRLYSKETWDDILDDITKESTDGQWNQLLEVSK